MSFFFSGSGSGSSSGSGSGSGSDSGSGSGSGSGSRPNTIPSEDDAVARRYFENEADTLFEFVDMRYYNIDPTQTHDFADDVDEGCSSYLRDQEVPTVAKMLAFVPMFVTCFAANLVALPSRCVAIAAASASLEHWYVRLRNLSTSEEFDLEYGPSGIKISKDAGGRSFPDWREVAGQVFYRKRSPFRYYTGESISLRLKDWRAWNYDLCNHNCQRFADMVLTVTRLHPIEAAQREREEIEWREGRGRLVPPRRWDEGGGKW